MGGKYPEFANEVMSRRQAMYCCQNKQVSLTTSLEFLRAPQVLTDKSSWASSTEKDRSINSGKHDPPGSVFWLWSDSLPWEDCGEYSMLIHTRREN